MNSPRLATILVIDDEEDFCFFVKANLQALGPYQVVIATNGEDGIELAQDIRPDLILLDIMMPHMNGFEVLKALKRHDSTMVIPVVMLTAKNDDPSKQEAARLYDDDYLVKPVQAEVLKAKIEQILSRFGRK